MVSFFMCKCASPSLCSDEITTQFLLSLDSLEQGLEVSSAKAREVVALDDLNEHRGAVHQMLSNIST